MTLLAKFIPCEECGKVVLVPPAGNAPTSCSEHGATSALTPSVVEPDRIAVTLLIDNFYDGDKIKTTVETTIPAPPPKSDEDAYQDWEYDHIFEHTGTGRTEGNSCYFVTVASSSRPDLLPVGSEFEFGT